MSSVGAKYWIYHERQEALLCGQHALNNLVQACVFSADSMAEIAHQLDQMELAYMAQNNEGGIQSKEYLQRVAEGSGNVDPSGNFSIEVLRAALSNKYGLELPNIRQQGVGDSIDVTDMEGFICNRSEHWFAIRKINGRFWNLNSTQERPVLISHFRLAAEIMALQESGYSVFCVPKGLPPPCSSKAQRERGLPQYWWKEEDLVKGKTSDAVTAATDPWRDVGSGMRLDGKSATATNGNLMHDDLTEEEMMQMALAASLEKPSIAATAVEIPPEPSANEKGSVRIQFRLPNGKSVVRRFLDTESVNVVFAFAESQSNDGQGRHLELRYGFPPQDLTSLREKSIAEASLAGQSLQGRYT